jgi:hypothetical protein
VRKVLVETSNKSESFIFKDNKQGDSKEVSFLLNCSMFFFFLEFGASKICHAIRPRIFGKLSHHIHFVLVVYEC